MPAQVSPGAGCSHHHEASACRRHRQLFRPGALLQSTLPTRRTSCAATLKACLPCCKNKDGLACVAEPDAIAAQMITAAAQPAIAAIVVVIYTAGAAMMQHAISMPWKAQVCFQTRRGSTTPGVTPCARIASASAPPHVQANARHGGQSFEPSYTSQRPARACRQCVCVLQP